MSRKRFNLINELIEHNHLDKTDDCVARAINSYESLRWQYGVVHNRTKQRLCKRLDKIIQMGMKNMLKDANVILENVPEVATLYQSDEKVYVTVEHLIDTIYDFTGIMPEFAVVLNPTSYLFKIPKNEKIVVKQFNKFIMSGNILKCSVVNKPIHIVAYLRVLFWIIGILAFIFSLF